MWQKRPICKEKRPTNTSTPEGHGALVARNLCLGQDHQVAGVLGVGVGLLLRQDDRAPVFFPVPHFDSNPRAQVV